MCAMSDKYSGEIDPEIAALLQADGPPASTPRFEDLFKVDKRSGDHYYRLSDYYRIFQRNGFTLIPNKQKNFITFIAVKNDSTKE